MKSPMSYLNDARDWLDGHGKPAWIAAMILGFIFFWPIGLFLLYYMMGTNRMWNKNCGPGHNRRYRRHFSSGNTAFDAYRDETLRRLEDEQKEFESFLHKLRQAKDKAEFDQFMANRGKDAPVVDEPQENRRDEPPAAPSGYQPA